MKHVLFALVIMSFAANARAHAYRTQDCVNDRLKFSYTGNYPIGGRYVIYGKDFTGDYYDEGAPVFFGLAADENGETVGNGDLWPRVRT